jgi:hypothetical protein
MIKGVRSTVLLGNLGWVILLFGILTFKKKLPYK